MPGESVHGHDRATVTLPRGATDSRPLSPWPNGERTGTRTHTWLPEVREAQLDTFQAATAASGTYAVERATFHGRAPRERLDYLRELLRTYQCDMDVESAEPHDLSGWAIRQRTTARQLIGWRLDGSLLARRRPGHIRLNSDQDYRLLVPTSGTIDIRRGTDSARVHPGAAAMCTMSSPFQLELPSGSQAFMLTVPRNEIDARLNSRTPVTSVLALTTGLGRVVTSMLTALFTERDNLTRSEFDSVCDRITELLCMIVAGDGRPGVDGKDTNIAATIRQYVRQHADRPELNGATVSRALGWSVRQVQVTLQRTGTTPRELIREERLRLVRDRLQNPRYRNWSISDIAYASGFASASTLSTTFRRRFGMSPRDFRIEAMSD